MGYRAPTGISTSLPRQANCGIRRLGAASEGAAQPILISKLKGGVSVTRSLRQGSLLLVWNCFRRRAGAEGTAGPDDDFIIVSWVAQGEDQELAEHRKAKNVLERNRAANIGA